MDIEANKNEIEEIKEHMKVMENIVGRNMISMDEKVKEEVDHQLKSELEI